jgi:cytochrome d ubiquinol oxidase subunit II
MVAVLALLLAGEAPLVRQALVGRRAALPVHAALLAATGVAGWALLRRRFGIARLAAGAQVSVVLWGWAWAQAPWIVPPDLSVASAAAPPVTLRLVLTLLAIGSAILAPSLWYLFRLFKGERKRLAHQGLG